MTKVVTLRILRLLAGSVLVLFALYCMLGVLQAMSLFTGERALRNVNLWSSLCLVAMALAALTIRSARRSAHKTTRSAVAPALWAILAVVVLWPVVKHLLAVDRCLDVGGSFNYIQGVCDTVANHQALSLAATHGFLLVAAVLAVLFAGRAVWRLRAKPDRGENGL